MRYSQYFLPTLKETPKEAEVISHQLMLRAGLIRQTSSGIYAWLPLGYKVLKKIIDIVREEQDTTGAHEMLMPTIQSAELWKQSGRYDAYGKEMLRITDRHDREMLFGPTNEEMITDIFKSYVQSYKDLPCNLYHIQWKFRDEIRPRFGVMRGREFLMKDAYSFDMTPDDARYSYQKYFLSYLRTFDRLGVKAIPMKADTGPIGGDLSHEFIILADTGESGVFVDKKWMEQDFAGRSVRYDDRDGLNDYFESVTGVYAATDEKHDAANCSLSKDELIEARGIEVGHIFYFGTKYSEAFGAKVADKEGNLTTLEMGSYGIGVSRVMAAVIEASHDENGIIWPEAIAPFDVAVINLKTGDETCDNFCNELYKTLSDHGKDVLFDDRDVRAGNKFADMDLIGVPWQIIVGPRGAAAGMVEIKNRKTGEKQEVSKDKILDII